MIDDDCNFRAQVEHLFSIIKLEEANGADLIQWICELHREAILHSNDGVDDEAAYWIDMADRLGW